MRQQTRASPLSLTLRARCTGHTPMGSAGRHNGSQLLLAEGRAREGQERPPSHARAPNCRSAGAEPVMPRGDPGDSDQVKGLRTDAADEVRPATMGIERQQHAE